MGCVDCFWNGKCYLYNDSLFDMFWYSLFGLGEDSIYFVVRVSRFQMKSSTLIIHLISVEIAVADRIEEKVSD